MTLPTGFVYLSDINPNIIQDVRYASDNNFLGRKVKGYNGPFIIITQVAATALDKIQNELEVRGLSLKVFDAYRPQMACDDFWDWAQVTNDTKMQSSHYPSFKDKCDLFEGYIARYSNHSRGSTVDLTIFDKTTGEDLEMGGIFDYMGELSHTETDLVDNDAFKNRLLLKHYMEKHGFKNYWREWWHYEYEDEPFTKTPEDHYNFVVE